MAEQELKQNRSAAYRMLLIEAATVGICGLLFFVLASHDLAFSVFLGGLTFIVPNAVFVMFSLRTTKSGSSRSTLAWFYLGEVLKIVLTIVIFAICLIFFPQINIGLMFATYGVLLLMNLTGLALIMNN